MWYVELIDDNLEIYRKEFSTELELYKFLWEGLIIKNINSISCYFYYSDDGKLMKLAGYGKNRS